MFKTIRPAFAAALLLAGPVLTSQGAAAAQPVAPNQGEEFTVQYPAGYAGNIVGGGTVTVQGNGEGARYLHAPDAAAQPGRVARFVGQGESGDIAYNDSKAG